MRALLLVAISVLLSTATLSQAQTPGGLCKPIREAKETAAGYNAKWTELTSDQWQFLRGIYAMNPLTPPGLPYGDKAVLAQKEGETFGVILFVDGEKACTPMFVPGVLLKMLHEVATGEIPKEGDPL